MDSTLPKVSYLTNSKQMRKDPNCKGSYKNRLLNRRTMAFGTPSMFHDALGKRLALEVRLDYRAGRSGILDAPKKGKAEVQAEAEVSFGM